MSLPDTALESGVLGIIVAPAATGDEDTDTAGLLAAIAATITEFGPDGGPVYLRPNRATVPYRLAVGGTLTLPKAGGLIGPGSGGRSLDGGAGNPDRVGCMIDAQLLTTEKAIDFGSAGSFQRVEGIFLKGPNPTIDPGPGLSSTGIDAGYFSICPLVRDVYFSGFGGQLQWSDAKGYLVENCHGKISGAYGVYSGGGSTGVIRDSLFADSGFYGRAGGSNIILDGDIASIIDCSMVDEAINNGRSIWLNGCEDVDIRVRCIYVGHDAGNIGVLVAGGSLRTRILGSTVRPYNPVAAASKGIVIEAGAVDTVLEDVMPLDFPALNGIQDAGTGTLRRGYTPVV